MEHTCLTVVSTQQYISLICVGRRHSSCLHVLVCSAQPEAMHSNQHLPVFQSWDRIMLASLVLAMYMVSVLVSCYQCSKQHTWAAMICPSLKASSSHLRCHHLGIWLHSALNPARRRTTPCPLFLQSMNAAVAASYLRMLPGFHKPSVKQQRQWTVWLLYCTTT